MDVYLVGGAVRDSLLGRPVSERDWVVVGATPETMLRLGYRQVGRDFPVFLHPDSGEEYALARTERKSGPGHQGFVCHTGPDVTLEDDLRRRDLTVNAMAQAADGTVIDPFGGASDARDGRLRHVSEAFVEDPLRVYRVARFAAQLPGFEVATETLELMQRMQAAGALAELPAERVWRELRKALEALAPIRFFEVLDAIDAWQPWLEELHGERVRLPDALGTAEQRFAALAWGRPVAAIRRLAERLKAPTRFRRIAVQVAAHGATLAAWTSTPAPALLAALNSVGALDPERDPGPLLEVVGACAETNPGPLGEVVVRLRAVSAEPFLERGLSGKAVGDAIHAARLAMLKAAHRRRPD